MAVLYAAYHRDLPPFRRRLSLPLCFWGSYIRVSAPRFFVCTSILTSSSEDEEQVSSFDLQPSDDEGGLPDALAGELSIESIIKLYADNKSIS